MLHYINVDIRWCVDFYRQLEFDYELEVNNDTATFLGEAVACYIYWRYQAHKLHFVPTQDWLHLQTRAYNLVGEIMQGYNLTELDYDVLYDCFEKLYYLLLPTLHELHSKHLRLGQLDPVVVGQLIHGFTLSAIE